MNQHQSFHTRIVVPVVGAIFFWALTAVLVQAYADPLLPIKQAIEKDRKIACPNSGILSGDSKLEAIAQAYARSEKLADTSTPPPGYSRLLPFLGSGDPQAQAINSAYRRGAGAQISRCVELTYGVGFTRHDDRSVDVVTIVFGELAQPRHPASISLKPGVGSFYISGSGFTPNSKVTITYNYIKDGVTTNSNVLQVDSSGNFATIVAVSTLIEPHGELDVEAIDNGGLSTTKSINF